ncbi:MAG: hypothetical protein R2932_12795 [Caldilineaceae bacterium]
MVWTLHDFDVVPLAEFRYPWQRGAQANMGVIRRNGTMKPAALLVNPSAQRKLTTISKWQQYGKPFAMTLFVLLLLIVILVARLWQRYCHR